MDKIICIGKNYPEHARELGDAVPEKPVLFLKPPGVSIRVPARGDTVEAPFPANRGLLHHECEIVVRIGRSGSNLSVAEAEAAIDAVTLGLDMTLRDVQQKLKKAGQPWEVGKVFAGSAILGPWITGHEAEAFRRQSFSIRVDGEVRQTGHEGQMSLTPAECVAYASEYFPLFAGDVLYTGTPKGVGPIVSGSKAELFWGESVIARVTWR